MELEALWESPMAGERVEKVADMAVVLLEAELVERVCWRSGGEGG